MVGGASPSGSALSKVPQPDGAAPAHESVHEGSADVQGNLGGRHTLVTPLHEWRLQGGRHGLGLHGHALGTQCPEGEDSGAKSDLESRDRRWSAYSRAWNAMVAATTSRNHPNPTFSLLLSNLTVIRLPICPPTNTAAARTRDSRQSQ